MTTLFGRAEYSGIPQSQETLNNMGAKSLKFDPETINVPDMNNFIQQQQQINCDYAKELAKLGTGGALEIGAGALLPAGLGLGAKLGTGLLKPIAGKAIGRAIGQGLTSGGLSGAVSGFGRGLIEDKPFESGFIGGVGGALGGGALGALGGYTSKLNSARKLIYHKPYETMNKEEARAFKGMGKKYYKDYIQFRSVENPYYGKFNFVGSQAGKPDYKFMEQYPFLRKNLQNASDNIGIKNNKERIDSLGFNNIKVNFKGKDYDYQIRKNSNNLENDFYNIKPYELFEKELNQGFQKESKLYDLIHRQ